MSDSETHFRQFAVSLEKAIERYSIKGKKRTREQFSDYQKDQLNTLLGLEDQFRVALINHGQGERMYKAFVRYICDEKRNILAARPFFRERQRIFTRSISKALKAREIEKLHKFRFNFTFIQFVLGSYDWRPNSKVVKIARQISKLRWELVTMNLPLAISRARIFFSRTPRSHLEYMDFVDIACEGLMNAIDKYVPSADAGAFPSVAIQRMTGNFIEEYSVDQDTVLYPCGQKPKKIKDFKPGDKIYGVDDFGNTIETEVIALHDHGMLEGYEVTFDDGYQITCSRKHKFLTRFGMEKVEDIWKKRLEVICEPSVQDRWARSGMRNCPKDAKRVGGTQGCVSGLSSSSFGEEKKCGKEGSYEVLRQQHRTSEGRLASVAYSDAPLSSTGNLVCRKVVRVRSVGLCRMYDIEVAHPKHNFLLPNGIVTSNSETKIHFYPVDKRKIYRANKILGRQSDGPPDFESLVSKVNLGVEKSGRTNPDELAGLLAAQSCISIEIQVQQGEDAVRIEERFAAPEETQPDAMCEAHDSLVSLASSMEQLSCLERKILKLRGVSI